MTVEAVSGPRVFATVGSARRQTAPRIALQAFLVFTAALWLLPIVWAVYTSLRPYSDTAERGYVSLPGVLNLQNYINAWTQADLPHYYANTLIIVGPALVLTLLLSSFVAFVVARFPFRYNLTLLMVFTAGNLLPQQTIITPLYRMYLALPLPEWLSDTGLFFDSYVGVIAIHVAFQMGFCTFVLSNYMKTIPKELTEAALVDGASVWRTFWSVIVPLTRPALAALATLEFTFIYNDYFWAIVLVQTGAKRPITSALSNLQGLFFTDNNLIAAGAVLVALPTIITYLLLQRHFVRGLTLGATKG
ncbi:MAG: carbohydrate ABC transporter permease [Chloroflexi bacterium]|nr:MAG: carbohydrate ABC transporter permease [Chloroflexota bacterium]